MVVAIATLLSGCATQLSAFSVLPIQRATAAVEIRLLVAGHNSSTRMHRSGSQSRHPTFVSPDTVGASVTLTGSTTITVALSIAPGAVACGGSVSSPRTCQSNVVVPAGTYSLTVNTYDQAPVSGTIPGTAHKLATGTVGSVVVTAGAANMTTVYVGGVITSYGNPQTFISLSANGTTQQIGFALNPKDYDAEVITAGTTVPDTYANPITLTLTEAGGSGHETLVLNGSNVGTSATITRSSDSVQVSYDGAAQPTGYTANVAISASGVATTNITISPLFVTPGGTYGQLNAVRFTATGQTSAVAITEASAPNTVTYTATLSGCTNIATTSAIAGSGASASFTITAGTVLSQNGCVVTVSDNLGTSTSVAIAIALIGIVHHPGLAASPRGMTVGSDNNIWFTEETGLHIGTMNTTTFVVTEYVIPGTAKQMASGSDGNVWFSEPAINTIGSINPSTHVVNQYSAGITTGAQPTGMTSGPDGNIWFTEVSANNVGMINVTTHIITEYPVGAAQNFITTGPDNNMWFSEAIANQVSTLKISTHAVSNVGVPGASNPNGLVSGQDGNLWFTEMGASRIVSINPTTHAETSYSAGITPGASPIYIACGQDGILWFSENGKNRVASFNPSTHAVVEYPLPTGTNPFGLTLLAHNIWFSENGTTKIGQLSPP